MLTTFSCPNCGAALEHETGSRKVSVKCAYCSSTVIVPDKLRQADRGAILGGQQEDVMAEVLRLINEGRKIEAIKLFRETFGVGLKEAKKAVEALEAQESVWLGDTAVSMTTQTHTGTTTPPTRSAGSRIGCIMVLFILLAGVGVAAFFILGEAGSNSGTNEVEGMLAELEESVSVVTTRVVNTDIGPTAPSGFAEVVLEFGGEEGPGPGFFNDTRRLGIDAAGNIYTGDYSGGRIQVFTAEGDFRNQFVVDPDLYMVSMTVDREGTVYVAVGNEVHLYNGQTGEFVDALPITARVRAMATAPDGSIVMLTQDETLLRLDAQGNVVLEIPDAFANIANFSATRSSLAVDGASNIYVLGNESIYVLAPDGAFLTRVGSAGEELDQFQSPPTSVTVDGQGRIYVDDIFAIKVYDANGRYVDSIDFSGVAFDMLVTDDNELLLMDRNNNRVVAYRFNR